MGRIKQLDTVTTNMIAAGEVVERPMGVVKELVENAIDAGSTRIDVLIEEGGLKKICVQDNGIGMDASDAEMAFQRHATSKIRSQNDLWTVQTLGFRGEALPSIASVAKVTMVTSDGTDATRIVIEYGKKVSVSPYPCNQGTEISVEGLFYRTPARLKHMRSGSYEASLIQDVILKFAMSHPEISFHLVNEGKETFASSGQGDLLEVIFQAYGRSAAENAVPVSFRDYDYEVNGCLVKPSVSRASRNAMHLFLNGRMVRTYKLFQAVRDGYDQMMPAGRFPVCVLDIQMDPHLLDVNVHPSKWEVRLSKEIQLEDLLRREVREALKAALPVPEASVKEARTYYYEPMSFDPEELLPAREEPKAAEPDRTEAPKEEPRKETAREEEPQEEKPVFPPLEPVGQYHGKYILCAAANGLGLIRQSGALARIRYEEILKGMKDGKLRKELLLPVTLQVRDTTVRRCEELNELLKEAGIIFEPFGHDTLAVRSLPVWAEDVKADAFLQDLTELFENGELDPGEVMKKTAAVAVRRLAPLKQMTESEMKELVRRLSRCENPFRDPSGRPVFIILDEKELEKEFRR
jgi:DNA mismatch repair protein MutL